MTIIITPENEGRRLDKFLFAYFNNAPHSFIYKLLRKKRVKLNSRRAIGGESLQTGDELRFFLSQETIDSCRKPRIFATAKPLTDIIFEDDNLLIINKPAGLPSQGGMPETRKTAMASGTSEVGKSSAEGDSSEGTNPDHLLARMLFYLQEHGNYSPYSDFIPALCNRLDVNTSGLIICGKNLRALQTINALFADRAVNKEYLAVAHGVLGKVGHSKTLEGYYQKDPHTNTALITLNPLPHHLRNPQDSASHTENPAGKTLAITAYTVLATSKDYSLLSIKPITGRSHQIRAHLASIGHPLAGDKKYGGKPTPYAPAQLLHCLRLELTQQTILPYPPGIAWEAPLPEGFELCLREWFD